jgi:hypothetical protein
MESSNTISLVFVTSKESHTVMGEVVQLRHIAGGSVRVTRVWQTRVRISQLIKERVHHGVDGRQTLGWRVFEQFRDQIDRIRISLPEHL